MGARMTIHPTSKSDPSGDAGGAMTPVPELTCYKVARDAMEIAPGRSSRPWMDETDQRFAYRCIPLSIANASGWEIVLPFSFTAIWNGGSSLDDLTIVQDGASGLVCSHFGHGVLTFHTGWLFRTSPGWALWCRGAPNHLLDGIVPLEGVVETDWLPFPFTMNWRFTAPGAVHFEQGEAICFVTLVPHAVLDLVTPRVRELEDDPALKAQHDAWSGSRNDFNSRLAARDADAVKEGWQRTYVRGTAPAGEQPSMFHRSKRKLERPR
jgi:hypothetical protein